MSGYWPRRNSPSSGSNFRDTTAQPSPSVKVAANILNFMDSGQDEVILGAINDVDGPLSAKIRDLMFVFDNLADIESGIVADWYRNAVATAPLELSPYLYSLTGHPDTKVVIGKMSGIPTVEIYLDKLGLKATTEQKQEIVGKIKEKAYQKMRLLTLGEFEELARKVLA